MLKPYERQFFDAFFWQTKVPLRAVEKTGKILAFHAFVKAKKYLETPDPALLKRCGETTMLKIGQHELLAVLPLRGDYVILGPALIVEPENIPSLFELTLVGAAAADRVDIAEIIPVVSPTRLCAYLRMLSLALLRKDVNVNELLEKCLNTSVKQIDKEFVKARFESLEKQNLEDGLNFFDERRILEIVKDGDEERLSAYKIEPEKFNLSGFMSANQLRNVKYMGVGVTSLVANAASVGGIADAEVYVLCGTYFQRIDQSETPEEIYALIKTMLLDFCRRVRRAKTNTGYTKPVSRAVAYIKAHTHQRLTVLEVAKEAGVGKDTLYREFVKQLSLTPSAYIQSVKIEEAKELLIHTDFSATEIAAYLDFSSQSHFIDTFKRLVGFTPKEFRNRGK
ncbi:MAG: AraC family transcriptional regulator [Clostridiales bacterium]|jgi:AraC-like DNA-binding protein|nr:AraC family transcriptional regulator [Clostridiales bacterium]